MTEFRYAINYRSMLVLTLRAQKSDERLDVGYTMCSKISQLIIKGQMKETGRRIDRKCDVQQNLVDRLPCPFLSEDGSMLYCCNGFETWFTTSVRR